jgi:arsenite-transporting ATPase
MLVLQIIGPGMGDAYLKMKLGDQKRALQMVADDPHLQQLQLLNSPLLDMEVRGVPALDYFAGIVWSPVLAEYTTGDHLQMQTGSLNNYISPALCNRFFAW